MKTTIDLPDELFSELKERAKRDNVPMRDLVIEGVRQALAQGSDPEPEAEFQFPVGPRGNGLRPGVTVRNMIELSYEDRW
ncbi:MAG: hypothetical protein ACRCYQ_13505 [Nocardioides sp.]